MRNLGMNTLLNRMRGWLSLALFIGCMTLGSSFAIGADQLTGTLYSQGNNKVLYQYRRSEAKEGEARVALQEYFLPGGKLAARGRARYEKGELVYFEMEELQAGLKGSARIVRRGKEGKIHFTFSRGGRVQKDTETLRPNTVVNDSIPDFLASNWVTLMNGKTVPFRYIAVERAETVGFEFTKVGETTWKSIPAVQIRMRPSSFIIARLVNPLVFTVEKGGAHRVLAYKGRTTPKQKVGSKWKDLEAFTVFDF